MWGPSFALASNLEFVALYLSVSLVLLPLHHPLYQPSVQVLNKCWLNTHAYMYIFIYLYTHTYIYIYIYFFLVFLGLHPQHMEVPSLGVELEL